MSNAVVKKKVHRRLPMDFLFLVKFDYLTLGCLIFKDLQKQRPRMS